MSILKYSIRWHLCMPIRWFKHMNARSDWYGHVQNKTIFAPARERESSSGELAFVGFNSAGYFCKFVCSLLVITSRHLELNKRFIECFAQPLWQHYLRLCCASCQDKTWTKYVTYIMWVMRKYGSLTYISNATPHKQVGVAIITCNYIRSESSNCKIFNEFNEMSQQIVNVSSDVISLARRWQINSPVIQ